MPNWCYNRVNVYGDSDTVDQVKEIYEIFENNNDPFHKIFPIPDFKNIPNDKGELPILEQHKNDKGEIVWETYNFQMVRMMIDGIIGVLRTGEQSGTVQNFALNTWMMNNWNSLLVLRGVHPKESLKSCVKSILTYHSLVSMMNQEWRLQDTIRTV